MTMAPRKRKSRLSKSKAAASDVKELRVEGRTDTSGKRSTHGQDKAIGACPATTTPSGHKDAGGREVKTTASTPGGFTRMMVCPSTEEIRKAVSRVLGPVFELEGVPNFPGCQIIGTCIFCMVN